MSEFSELFLELRAILDEPETVYSKISMQLDPNLVDKLNAFAAARNEPLPETVLTALRLFMFAAAENAWCELSGETGSEGALNAAPLNIILERFLTIALDPSRQKLIQGPGPASILNQFLRIREKKVIRDSRAVKDARKYYRPARLLLELSKSEPRHEASFTHRLI